LNNDLLQLRQEFINSGYPLKFVDKTIKQSRTRFKNESKAPKQTKNEDTSESRTKLRVGLRFSGDNTKVFAGRLKKL
jgi:hypothetical protein